MVSDEAPEVSPTMTVAVLTKRSLMMVVALPLVTTALSRKLNVVAPLVAISPLPILLSTSRPLVNVLVPDVCHERALELLKADDTAPERLIAPVMRPPLTIMIEPLAVVTAMARSEARPPIDAIVPPALLLSVMDETLPLMLLKLPEALTTEVPADVPKPLIEALLLMVTAPFAPKPAMAEPPLEVMPAPLVTDRVPLPLLKAKIPTVVDVALLETLMTLLLTTVTFPVGTEPVAPA